MPDAQICSARLQSRQVATLQVDGGDVGLRESNAPNFRLEPVYPNYMFELAAVAGRVAPPRGAIGEVQKKIRGFLHRLLRIQAKRLICDSKIRVVFTTSV